MRVLHVAPYATPAYGGPGVAIRSMAQALSRQGAEVDVVTTNAAGPLDLSLEDGAVCVEDGVQFRYFHRKFPRGWFRAPGMVRWLQAHAGDYDLLHLHVPFTAPFRAGARAARAAGRPYVATLHGVLDPWSLAQKAWKKRPYMHYLEKDVLAGAAVLHVTAALEERCVNAMHLGPAVRCLPLAVPLPAVPMGCPQSTGSLRVLSISRLHPVKALPVLFAAVAKMRADGRSILLDIAGEGDASYAAKLRQQVDDFGLRDAVIWHGHVDEEQKRYLLAEASCVALLSYHENFGLAAAESLAAGVPVVVSNQVGLAPDVQAYQAGRVVAVGDANAAAQAISNVIDPKNSLAYREQARKLAEECYGSSSLIAGLTTMYRDVLQGNSNTPRSSMSPGVKR